MYNTVYWSTVFVLAHTTVGGNRHPAHQNATVTAATVPGSSFNSVVIPLWHSPVASRQILRCQAQGTSYIAYHCKTMMPLDAELQPGIVPDDSSASVNPVCKGTNANTGHFATTIEGFAISLI